MQLDGKLDRRGGVNAIRPGRLLFLQDHITGVKYLVDTGASVSMLPGPCSSPGSSSSVPPLETVNGTPIATGGERRLSLTFKSTSPAIFTTEWDFVVGEVSGPLLGNDFIKANNLCVDPANACVRNLRSGSCYPAIFSFSSSAAAVLPSNLTELLHQFPAVVADGKPFPPAAHGVEHFLETSGPPVTARFRRLDADKLAAAKTIFDDWEASGIVRRSGSSWASPLHLVKKKDGSWRPCGDFRRLNLVTAADKYPVPNMGDFTGQIEGCSVFSKLDLKNGYLQVPLHGSAVPKTAVITPFGLYEFLRMPFGLKNAGMSFQRFMDRVLSGLPFVFVYIDDILVASPDLPTHMQHLQAVFSRLQEAGLVLNVKKCEFAKPVVEFLGHSISSSGSTPLVDKVAAISKYPIPNTIRELQQFLGVINFYRKFIPAAARLLCPLTNALKGSPSGSSPLSWSTEMRDAFSAAKSALSTVTSLAHPVSAAELALVCDASATHVGAVIQQRRSSSSSWEPLGFFSKKLDKPQLIYSAFDRELFAAFAAIRHFRYQLEGRQFQLWTDHKPLLFAVKKVDEAWTPRQQRQLAYIAEYTADIRHVAGVDNVVADALSRPPGQLPSPVEKGGSAGACSSSTSAVSSLLPVQSSPGGLVDLAAIAADQHNCSETIALSGDKKLQVTRLGVGDQLLLCSTATGSLRPLVPKSHRRAIFTAVHGLAHPGIRATRRLITSRWLWKGMSTDIAAWCRDCQHCQRGKVTRQYTAPLQPIAIPSRRFSHIHVDLVGPLPSSGGASNLLTIIDRSTRWLEAIPLQSTTATAVADALVAGWIARFGVPAELTSDRGVQFSSEVWAILMNRLGIRHHLTTAYHPQSNGMIERTHRQLKDALRARLAGDNWLAHLPYVLLSLRATPKEDSNLSSAELVYGAPILLPGQLQQGPEPPPSTFTAADRCTPLWIPTRPPSSTPASAALPGDLADARYVYVRHSGVSRPLTPAYSGPFLVVERSPKVFKIDLGDRCDTVSVDRLKPHLGAAPLLPATAPRRGRPPSSVPSHPDSQLGAG